MMTILPKYIRTFAWNWKNQNEDFCILIHSANPQSRAGSDHCCPSLHPLPFFKSSKTKQQKTMVATGETVGLAEWIIDDAWLVNFYFCISRLENLYQFYSIVWRSRLCETFPWYESLKFNEIQSPRKEEKGKVATHKLFWKLVLSLAHSSFFHMSKVIYIWHMDFLFQFSFTE